MSCSGDDGSGVDGLERWGMFRTCVLAMRL